MTNSPQYVFSVGDCPVTPGAEMVLVVVARESGQPVFWCPFCGCAWNSVPSTGLDEIHSLAEVAPSGIRLATEDDVAGVVLGDRHLLRLPYQDWSVFIDDVVGGDHDTA